MDRKDLSREVWIASIGILILLGALKHLGAISFIGDHAYTAAAAAQLYIPIMLIGRRGITRDDLALRFGRWRRDLGIASLLGLITLVPFAIGHHFWRLMVMKQRFDPKLPEPPRIEWLTGIAPALSDPITLAIVASISAIAIELLVVALPEELYFRGYLQGRMEKLWLAKRTLFGAPFGRALFWSSLVFALAHFVGEYQPHRLGPFFPALLFGILRSRTQSVVAPIAYHALCNLMSQVLSASYRY